MQTQALDLNRTIEVSDEQIEFYQQNGYLQIHNVLSEEEVEQVREDLAAVIELRRVLTEKTSEGETRYRDLFHQTVNIWRDHEGIRQFVLSRRLGEIARRLAGVSKIRLWHDHSLVKMPNTNTPSPWHQDWVYWPMNHTGALSCWMALDDVTHENGCLSFVPESYRWGPYPSISLNNPENIFKMVEPELQPKLKPVSMPMKAGSCTFHDGLCFHYAPGNTTAQARRAIALIYMPDGTTYRKKGHCVTDPLNLEDGVKLEGEMFPVVAEGEPGPTTTFIDAAPALAKAAELQDKRLTAAGVAPRK